MPAKTSYDRDLKNGIKRVMVRMTKDEVKRVALTRERLPYPPTVSAIIRRGIELACVELDSQPGK